MSRWNYVNYDFVAPTSKSVQLKRDGKVIVTFKCDDPSGAISILEDLIYDLRREAADEAVTDHIYAEDIARSFHSE